MLKKILFILLSSTSMLMAMEDDIATISSTSLLQAAGLSLNATEKKPEEIIARERKKNNAAFLSANHWLTTMQSDFSEQDFSTHPLFSVFIEAKALADFEVDALEKFSSEYFQPHKEMIQGLAIKDYITNALSAKLLLSHLIYALQDETSILNTIYQLLESRLEEIAEQSVPILNDSLIEAVRIKSDTTDPTHKEMYALFARSYNTKNKIIRSLCDYLREKKDQPLSEVFKSYNGLTDLFKLSPSLHPYFNHKVDDWTDYEPAIEAGEGLDYLRYITAKKDKSKKDQTLLKDSSQHPTLKKGPVTRMLQKLSAAKLPNFLTQVPQPLQKLEEKKDDVKTPPLLESSPSEYKPEPFFLLPEETASSSSIAETSTPATISLDVALAEKSSELRKAPSHVGNISPHQTLTKKPEALQLPKYSNKHINTIYDIFSPEGYKKIDASSIINAWNHVLEGKGYHKKGTGRSHQPLYAELSDGKRIVLGLFISDSYGPRYIQYVREAFRKIGFDEEWLKTQGYKID